MKSFLFENIVINSADNIDEMKAVFKSMIEDKKAKYISFINPEIFMQQQKCKELHDYFHNSKYNFIDGIGLLYAINKKLGTSFDIKSRYPGTDFFTYLPEREIKIFLFGSKPGNAIKAKEKIETKYPYIKISGCLDGYTEYDNDELLTLINTTQSDILIVCTGCPKQELWIRSNLEKLSIPLVFGNGGAIDFWSNSVKRAPEILINHGLEWLFRLFQNFTFKRISRQLKLIMFFIKYKLKKYQIEELK